MKVLVIFSDPPSPRTRRLRLDKEDHVFALLAQKDPGATVTRVHASEVADVHSMIIKSEYDVIHISGHGSPQGVYLEGGGGRATPELVTARRLQSLLGLARRPPLLVVLLYCYSDASIEILSELAPFVVTGFAEVGDTACSRFTEGFYEWLFQDNSVTSSFEHACIWVETGGFATTQFRLERRGVRRNAGGLFVKSLPDPRRESLLVNLDAVSGQLDKMPVPREKVLFLLERKIAIHGWIFGVPRENAILPVGNLIFGEFSWADARDVIYCSKLCVLDEDMREEQRNVWYRLLLVYNDLASCPYRGMQAPASPASASQLTRDLALFTSLFDRHVRPLRGIIEKLGFGPLLTRIDFALAELEYAKDQLAAERLGHVVESMEKSLSFLHEVVDALLKSKPSPQAV